MSNQTRILIASGVTGGHFFPALCFAECFRKRHPDSDIGFLLSRAPSFFDSSQYPSNLSFRVIPLEPFGKLFSRECISAWPKLFKAYCHTFRFLREFKPASVVSFGSYSSVPVVFLAWCLRIPVVVHEQNVVMGWANRLGSLLAKRVAVSFPKTIGIVTRAKVVWTGFPVRDQLRAGPREFFGNPDKFCVLALGGSQGASVLNRVVVDFFHLLSVEEMKKFAVIHITGRHDFEAVRQQYRALPVQHEVYSFVNDMGALYRKANVVLSRAGAGTVFELAAAKLPGVLMPYRFAYAHQFQNARILEKCGAAVVCAEDALTAERLREIVFGIANDRERQDRMKAGLAQFDRSDAAVRLVELTEEVCLAR